MQLPALALQAMPWEAVHTPPHVPPPNKIMLGGILEFGDQSHYYTFVSSVLAVPFAFFVLFLVRKNVAGSMQMDTNGCKWIHVPSD